MTAAMTLLGLPEAVLRFALTQRTMSAGKRKSISTIPLTRQQALDARNGLAKAVYERLFLHVVAKVNQATLTGAGEGSSGAGVAASPFFALLDIFGFEVLESNGCVRAQQAVALPAVAPIAPVSLLLLGRGVVWCGVVWCGVV